MKLLLKLIHKAILVGMPLIAYNPFSNKFNAPFTVKPYSTYLNFKLDDIQKDYLTSYIHNFSTILSLTPIKLSPSDTEGYYLSVNIYNCSSPLFLNNDIDITRCEINTYVKDINNNYGTLIIDYNSNGFSLDPVNLFKPIHKSIIHKEKDKDKANIHKDDSFIKCSAKDKDIDFRINYNHLETKKYHVSDSLVSFTDYIFYKNGICDKLFYDSSLTNSLTKSPKIYNDFYFKYKDLEFTKIHSIFYFTDELRFVCNMWDNLYL